MSEFNSVVHLYFDELADRYGLICVKSTNRQVRFQSEDVFLQVLYDVGRSSEIGVEIGQVPAVGGGERPFNLAEILRLQNSPDANFVANLAASQSVAREHVIAKLAGLTKAFATRLLEGSNQDFLNLARFRDKECSDYALAREMRYLRRDAESAWREKDYPNVVEAYGVLGDSLTPSEKMRLEFAKKRSAKK